MIRWNSLSDPRRSFWLALVTPAVLLVGVFISETLFVAPSGRVRPGRRVLALIFLVPATSTYIASWFYAFKSIYARDSNRRCIIGTVAINILVALWLVAVHLLSQEL